MKRIPFLLIATAVFCQAFTLQSKEVTLREDQKNNQSDTSNNMMLEIGNDALRIENQDSAVKVRVGNRGLSILESLEGKKNLEFEKYKPSGNHRWNQDYDEDEHQSGARSFRGHWSGLEIGFNNYNYVNSMNLPDPISYMSLDANSSLNFNLNFSQISVGFSRHAGFVSGIGINWNNYRFENRNSIGVGSDGTISMTTPTGTVPVKKSKFGTLYLNVPALLEFQIPAGYSNHLNVAAGVIGGLKLNAWTKVVFEDGEKSRTNGDYKLNLLRGGVTARFGYQNFMLYGTYYLTPWFQESKGPNGYNLEPFEIGLALTFND